MNTNNDHICINKFSSLHEEVYNVPIIFSKVDWLHLDFHAISKWRTDCIVVCGNSDYCVGNEYHPVGRTLVDIIPSNVKKLFCQNCLITKDHPNYDKVEPLPIGIENYVPCKRSDCGPLPPFATEKQHLLSTLDLHTTPITNKIYSNFTLRRNCQSLPHREKIIQISKECSHIEWQEPILTNEQFYKEVLNHEATVCAQGNGPGDNHRIYEVLYLNRIPITFNREMYDRMHKHFPVVHLEEENMLRDFQYMSKRILEAKQKMWNRDMLTSKYWIEKIKTAQI